MAWALRASAVVLAAVEVSGRKEKIDGIVPALIAPPLMSRRARAGELSGASALVLLEKISTAAGSGGGGGVLRSLPRRNDGSVLSPSAPLADVPEVEAAAFGAMDARGIRHDVFAFAFVLAPACARGVDANASASMSALQNNDLEKRKSVIAR